MRCSNPDDRWTRPSTTSSYPTLSDLAIRVSPVMGCMIASPAMATKIWSQPRNDWSPRGLGIKHLRLVFGISMGGMHAWLWGEQYPALMDAIIPVACQPDANSIDSPELGVIRKGVDGVNSFSHWPIITERFQWRLRA